MTKKSPLTESENLADDIVPKQPKDYVEEESVVCDFNSKVIFLLGVFTGLAIIFIMMLVALFL